MNINILNKDKVETELDVSRTTVSNEEIGEGRSKKRLNGTGPFLNYNCTNVETAIGP